MTRRPPHSVYLSTLAEKRAAAAARRLVDAGSVPALGSDQARRIELEQTLDDIDRAARLRRFADDLDWEPGPYVRGGYFRDLLNMADGDPIAGRRLAEHNKRTEERHGVEFRPSEHGGWALPEARAADSVDLAGLVPAAFAAVAAAGGLPRSDRPFLDAMLADGARIDMPQQGVQVTFVASTTASVSATTTSSENVNVSTNDVVMVDQQVDVDTVAASIVVSRQVVHRSDADEFIGRELRKALDEEQERRFVARLLAGATGVASNTVSHRWVGSTVLQAARAGADVRKQPTRVIAWHPRRWLWLSSTHSDTTGATFDTVMAQLAAGGHARHVLSHQLLETGSLAGRDVVIAANGDDIRYGEEPPRVFVAPQPGASTLSARLTAFRYVAWTPLFASQVAATTGAGLVAPATLATA